jgi:hypothetical protein
VRHARTPYWRKPKPKPREKHRKDARAIRTPRSWSQCRPNLSQLGSIGRKASAPAPIAAALPGITGGRTRNGVFCAAESRAATQSKVAASLLYVRVLDRRLGTRLPCRTFFSRSLRTPWPSPGDSGRYVFPPGWRAFSFVQAFNKRGVYVL